MRKWHGTLLIHDNILQRLGIERGRLGGCEPNCGTSLWVDFSAEAGVRVFGVALKTVLSSSYATVARKRPIDVHDQRVSSTVEPECALSIEVIAYLKQRCLDYGSELLGGCNMLSQNSLTVGMKLHFIRYRGPRQEAMTYVRREHKSEHPSTSVN